MAHRYMRNRLLSTSILFVALFVTAWGNALGSACCTHKMQDHSCCLAGMNDDSTSHTSHDMMGEMGDMQMGDMQMTPAGQESEYDAFGLSDAPCAHCIGHSQLPSATLTLREASQTIYGADVSAPLATSQYLFVAPSFIPNIYSKKHSPPGSTTARHVLISVFRI